MARPGHAPFQIVGPLGGMNKTLAPRLIPAGQWADASNVVNDDGSIKARPGYEESASVAISGTLQTDLTAMTSVRIDTTNNEVYYVEDGVIKKCSRWGGNVTTVLDDNVAAIVLDPTGAAGKKLFWLTSDGTLDRADLDGTTNHAEILNGLTVGASNECLDLDVANTYVYFTSGADIRRCDWTNAVATNAAVVAVKVCPQSFFVDVATLDKIYYVNADWGISRADLDGTSAEVMVTQAEMSNLEMDALTWDSGATDYIMVVHDASTIVRRFTMAGVAATSLTTQTVYRASEASFDPTDRVLYFVSGWGSTNQSLVRVNADAATKPISGFAWKRSLYGIDTGSGEFLDDLLLFQIYSTTDNYFNVFFPASGESYALWCRFSDGRATDTPSFFVTNDRDTDPSTGDDVLAKHGRATYAYMGDGLDTLKGGVMLAAGEGAMVFNYRVPQTDKDIYTVTIWRALGIDGASTFTLSDGDDTTGTPDDEDGLNNPASDLALTVGAAPAVDDPGASDSTLRASCVLSDVSVVVWASCTFGWSSSLIPERMSSRTELSTSSSELSATPVADASAAAASTLGAFSVMSGASAVASASCAFGWSLSLIPERMSSRAELSTLSASGLIWYPPVLQLPWSSFRCLGKVYCRSEARGRLDRCSICQAFEGLKAAAAVDSSRIEAFAVVSHSCYKLSGKDTQA